MKTVTLITFFVFFSYIKCQTFQRSLLDAAMLHINRQNYLEENLRDLTSIMVAQFLQKATYEEVQTIAKELLDLTEKCKNLQPHELPSECAHQLAITKLPYPYQPGCSINVMSEGRGSQGLRSPVNSLLCIAAVLALWPPSGGRFVGELQYNYETSRRHPFLYGPTILTTSACYEAAIQSCCQKENKTECLQIKLAPIRKYIRGISLRHYHLCEIGNNFSHKVAKAVELVLLTKKQPKADFSEIAKLTTDTKNLHQICCDGNAVACALGRAQLMSYICSNQAMLSSKITQCCEQPAPFRGECIINSENDRPALSSLPLSRFTEDPFVCKHFADKEDDFLQEFLYEYSRRHPELAVTVILRVEEAYKKELENCCKLENPLECYSHGEDMFQTVVREGRDRVKHHCDLREKLGDSDFHDRLVVLYTKKAPQLSAQELVSFTTKMAAIATKCCPLSDEQQFFCMEDSTKLIVGDLCRRHEAEPINAGVGHCCNGSYAFRKPCFDDLQVDGTYVSPSLSCDQVISLKEELCEAQEEELQIEKQKLLSDFVRQKRYAAEMQLQSIVMDFTHLVEKCCQAEKSGVCFQEEESKLIKKCQSFLEG
ncbi:alpha-fetoprotein [Tupaia chinensis]|uniref:alpha-fetoprotein n=1 Tax=Tupaia chinensis TaxID=246437 RepID=UPI0003C8DDB3|nr:alpha-fetoprotein [Tupaia chinensis]